MKRLAACGGEEFARLQYLRKNRGYSRSRSPSHTDRSHSLFTLTPSLRSHLLQTRLRSSQNNPKVAIKNSGDSTHACERNSTQTVVELLDGLCEKMLDHTLEKLDTGEEIWVRVHDWNNLPAGKDKQEAQAYSKYISSFCTRLLEETKDELMELLIEGIALKPGQISKALCQDLSKHCDESDEFDDDYMDDEL